MDNSTLEEEQKNDYVPANLEGYDLYLAEAGDSGGEGSISTMEPDGAHEEASVLSGVEFRSMDLISDLDIYGEGSNDLVRLSIYLQFKGQEGSTADLTFTLNAVGGQTFTETKELNDPCNSGVFNSDCSWTVNEVFFDVPEDGFTVEKGAQLRLQIDGSASCEGQGSSTDCDVLVVFGDLDSTNAFSRISVRANPLVDSEIKVHSSGSSWTDVENLEWAPNHCIAESRQMQFSVNIIDAFGNPRDHLQSIKLILSDSTSNLMEKTFTYEELILENDNLFGTYLWEYANNSLNLGEFNLHLEMTDVQGHTIVHNHQGIEFIEYGIYLSRINTDQPSKVIISPGQTSSIELMVENIGGYYSEVDVEMVLLNVFPSDWQDPIWDQPAGYSLYGVGNTADCNNCHFATPILQFEVPDDLSTAPGYLEIWARTYAENEDGIREEVAIDKFVIDVEIYSLYAPPASFLYDASKTQIFESNRPSAFDSSFANQIDFDGVGTFYIDIENSGFETDTFRLKVEDIPYGWSYQLLDNNTGMELTQVGVNSISPPIGILSSHTILMQIYPPLSRDGSDTGLIDLSITSSGDNSHSSLLKFTVQRNFGIFAEVTGDSDGGDLGSVSSLIPNDYAIFEIRVNNTGREEGQTRWGIISPELLQKNKDNSLSYSNLESNFIPYSHNQESNFTNNSFELESGSHIDLELTIKIPLLTVGEHTIYVRIHEESANISEPRYFDLPIVLVVDQWIDQALLIEAVSTNLYIYPSNYSTDLFMGIDFHVSNGNNVPLQAIIIFESSSVNGTINTNISSGDSLTITELPAFSHDDFFVILNQMEFYDDGDIVLFSLQVTPIYINQFQYQIVFSEFITLYSFEYEIYLDDDGDGYRNNNDYCNSTSFIFDEEITGVLYDNGCSNFEYDSDSDGVFDANDSCPNTNTTLNVNSDGCGLFQIDSDNDGVNDAEDAFPDDPAETKDSDGNGIGDNYQEKLDAILSDSEDSNTVNGFLLGVSISLVLALLYVIKNREKETSQNIQVTEQSPLKQSPELQNVVVEEWTDSSGYLWCLMSDGGKYWWDGTAWTLYQE